MNLGQVAVRCRFPLAITKVSFARTGIVFDHWSNHEGHNACTFVTSVPSKATEMGRKGSSLMFGYQKPPNTCKIEAEGCQPPYQHTAFCGGFV